MYANYDIISVPRSFEATFRGTTLVSGNLVMETGSNTIPLRSAARPRGSPESVDSGFGVDPRQAKITDSYSCLYYLYYIILYYIVLYHIISYHIRLVHIMTLCIILYQSMS